MPTITCPYCFATFDDKEVHFRMETVTKPNPNAMDELENMSAAGDIDDKTFDLKKNELRREEAFNPAKDAIYENWWNKKNDFGGTTETAVDKNGVPLYMHRVYNPNDTTQRQFFDMNKGFKLTDKGMVCGAYDCFGKLTEWRVCPRCHNPLPGNTYGQYPVMFFSIIGITGSGKTVYLSQLCGCIADQLSYYDIAVRPTSTAMMRFRETHPIQAGKPLPQPTVAKAFQQPLVFNARFPTTGGENIRTMVFYDIAGENVVPNDGDMAGGMKDYGAFITHSDGMILLIDPKQLKKTAETGGERTALHSVTYTLQTVFATDPDKLKTIPFAVCISKGDQIVNDVQGLQGAIPDMQFPMDGLGNISPVFNAEAYNELFSSIRPYIEQSARHVGGNDFIKDLKDFHFSYFLVSAIGGDVIARKDDNGQELYVPVAPKQIRLIEPLAWILTQRGLLKASGDIYGPNDWICPKCKQRYGGATEFCPRCNANKQGEWKCPKCGKTNEDTAEMCKTSGCKTNRMGQRKTLFGWR